MIKQFFSSSLFDEHTDLNIKVISEENLAYNRSWKKLLLDYLITIPLIILLIPLFIIVGIAIKLDSKGPIIFKQKRVGMDGKIFNMYKFRSMFTDADDSIHKARIQAYFEGKIDPEKGVKLTEDPRITRVGKFIRSTSIDELPQLFNVLKREMSLVGPRPVPIYEAEKYKLWQSERLRVLPGITGLWQVSGRSRVSFDEQLRLDIRYIRNQSLLTDIKILLYTIPAVLSKRGAG